MIATLVSTTTSSTTTDKKRREPLRVIEMTAAQAQTGRGRKTRGTRLSSSHENNNDLDEGTKTITTSTTENKKRKTGYDEDVEGFQFTRNASKKKKPSTTEIPRIPSLAVDNTASNSHEPQASPRRGRPPKKKSAADATSRSATVAIAHEGITQTAGRERTGAATRTRTGTGTRRPTDGAAVAPSDTPPQELPSRPRRKRDTADVPIEEKKRRKGRPSKSRDEERNGFQSPELQEREPGTSKVALPLADTPVIQRNKDMRGAKSGKQRRDSLGMRGRRASSLIDSGTSNALPHKEVDAADFYKHIASDGLPEPRRMRQLLIWCATRAMGDKPSNSRSEDQSAWLAARVIQEELLKDLSTNSEFSNWFGREDANPPAVVVKKPNPKNIQNSEKIKELEEQIQRLQQERHALNALLRPTPIPRITSSRSTPPPDPSAPDQEPSQSSSGAVPEKTKAIDTSVLDASQRAIVALLDPHAANKQGIPLPAHPPASSSTSSSTETPILPPFAPSTVSARLSRVTRGFGPTLDAFAAGIHDIELYRATADSVSSQILRICARRLDERDTRAAMGRLALREGESAGVVTDASLVEQRRDDLGSVLGALSRVERR